jgi:phenylpyruvate tautomerase PptA (4-oxalocrotonate tautomerase family)
MPFVRIDLRRGKCGTYLAALRDSVYQALRATFEVPEHDRFIVITQHDPDEFDCDGGYLGVSRSEDLLIIQITCAKTRGVTQKQALYRSLAEKLAVTPGVRREDVFVILIEAGLEDWSFGNGVAQFAAPRPIDEGFTPG